MRYVRLWHGSTPRRMVIYTIHTNFTDKRKPALRRAGWLEQCHCKPQTYVKYWCYDDGGYLGVLLAELFHLILLGWEPDCSGSLGLLHCDSDVVHRDSVVDQLLLELKGLLVPFEPAKED